MRASLSVEVVSRDGKPVLVSERFYLISPVRNVQPVTILIAITGQERCSNARVVVILAMLT